MKAHADFISWGDFVARYRPAAHGIIEGEPSRPMFETFGQDLLTVKRTKERYIWTVIDFDLTDSAVDRRLYPGEDGDNCWVIVPGYHYVNRIGYMITEVPWESEDIEVIY